MLYCLSELSEHYENQQKPNNNVLKFMRKQIDKADTRRTLTQKEHRRVIKLKAIATKFKNEGNVQNRQLETWLSEAEYI